MPLLLAVLRKSLECAELLLFMFHVPIVLIVFNRPDLVKGQINALRALAPSQLYVIADGPRANNDDDHARCRAVREAVDQVDWDCAVIKDYADENMGCAKRIVSGLDNVFSQVERAIILEDDCLAHPAFFDFCSELLDKYATNHEVMQICGTNLCKDVDSSVSSYRFSCHVVCWGWATWARAWQKNELDMTLTDERIHALLRQNLSDREAVAHWQWLIAKVRKKELDAWDYPWQLSIWREQGISVLPNYNLVSNQGFGEDATHTKNPRSPMANLATEGMVFPLVHPISISADVPMDARFVQEILLAKSKKRQNKSFIKRVLSRIANMFGSR